MPNIIVHSFFGEDVWNAMTSSTLKDAISANKEAYTIGCSGPDFLFFHVLSPIFQTKSHSLSKYGGQLHKHNINLFYASAIQRYQQQEDETIKAAMASYIAGHFLHWRLDSMVHPYVFYTTGYPDLLHMSHHHRAESMMDCVLLQQRKQQSIRQFKTYDLCTYTPSALDAISDVYVYALKICCKADVSKQEIKDALNNWKRIQRWLHDPYRIKFKIVSFIEKLIQKPWLVSGNIIPIQQDESYDVMNERQEIWYHPCDLTPSNESVEMLLEKAKREAIVGLKLLENALQSEDHSDFLNHIGDATYESGKDDTIEMLYQDDIYER